MGKSRATEPAISEEEKGFHLLVPFTIKDMSMPAADGEDMMEEEDESITIEGFANWYGEDVDEEGNGASCDLIGDAVVPTGIDLSVYKSNPQILWQHNRECSIGKANKVIRKKQGLFVNATIFKGAMCEEDWYRVKNGLVTRFSIGFRTLAGEYREINKVPVFFITKSLLLEISIVTIPCNSESGFTIVKALEDGSFTSSYTEPHPTPAVANHETKSLKKDDTMKVPLRELLSVDEVEHFKSLGLDAELDDEKEISTKMYIDAQVAKAAEAVKAEILAEIKAAAHVEETEPEAEVETETVEVKADESTEVAEPEAEVKAEATPQEEISTEIFKSLSEQVSELKALFI